MLVMGSIGEPSNLISALSTDSASHEVGSQLFAGLLKYDENLDIVPLAAESFEVLDGGLRLRFTLRKGMLWSDGNEVDVDDVEFTFRFITDPNTPTAYAGDFKQVKEFRKIDRYTFEVTYDRPLAKSLVSWMTDILPRRALADADLMTTPETRNPTGNGPFRLAQWNPGSSLLLGANPQYFEGRPFIDGLCYRIIPDTSTMFMELKAGKLDIMGLTPQQYVYQTQQDEFTQRFEIYKDISSAYSFLGYNLKSPLFSDKRVRQAFAYAVNKQDVISGALFDQGLPTIGPFKPGTWPYNDKIRDYPYDPQKALELLAECGWKKGQDGKLYRDGKLFTFTILVNQGNDQRVKTAILIQRDLRNIGIEAKIRTVEWAAFLKNFVMPGYYDALILGWNVTPDPDLFDVWHSSRIGNNGLNFMGYANPEVDRLIEEGRHTFDRGVRKRCYDSIQDIFHDEQPYLFLYVPYSITAVSKRFKGIEQSKAGIMYNLIRWWVPENRQLYRNVFTQ